MSEIRSHLNRYHALVSAAAGAALADVPAGAPLAIGAPPAETMLGRTTDLAAGLAVLRSGQTRFDDSLGFSRPIFHPLLVHLHLVAGAPAEGLLGPLGPLPDVVVNRQVGEVMWRALCHAEVSGVGPNVRATVSQVLDHPGTDGSLHPFDERDDLLDAWWYRELVTLHALYNLALLADDETWMQRVDAAAAYHLENTQPDHTTAQPWALAAFTRRVDTTPFANQQLHDAESYWRMSGPGSGLVAGMLLADAAWGLAIEREKRDAALHAEAKP